MKSESGFTLLEVMAALAIMVIALVPVLENQALNVKSTQRAYALSQATLLAAAQMAIYQGIGRPEQTQAEGSFDLPGAESFSYEFSRLETTFPLVERDVLIVRWGEKADERLELISYAVQKNFR